MASIASVLPLRSLCVGLPGSGLADAGMSWGISLAEAATSRVAGGEATPPEMLLSTLLARRRSLIGGLATSPGDEFDTIGRSSEPVLPLAAFLETKTAFADTWRRGASLGGWFTLALRSDRFADGAPRATADRDAIASLDSPGDGDRTMPTVGAASVAL